ncbi:BatA domain-containing protein [Stenotrophomonas sp. ISL-67]|uniref:BatA domain-containing protein n=1 Tax=Stenotrophomonas sp. ISL-67 TaxID=2819171 RepID=UPI001BE60D9F|nr:BatA domain-containing protein [Stenotrophomonas sp. ISL-67]MBT2767213.1 BatA domain-containing protein [Stenotrophomonas sp. ISL-67]
MSLLFPLGLLALASLLVPLLIHLARRHQYAPLEFAALRWLRAKARPRQRIRFDEWPLLLVRLLLLAALAVLLARPLLHGAPVQTPPWVVVAPGLERVPVPKGSEGHWLAPGFPSLQDPAPNAAQPLASLLRELDQRLPSGAALTVHVPDPMPGLDGERPQLSRAVEWRPVAAPVDAATPNTAPRLRLSSAAADAQTLRVLDAVQRAWSGQPLAPPLSADSAPANGEVGVWLANAPLSPAWQAWAEAGGNVIALSAAAAPGKGTPLLPDSKGKAALSRHALGRGQLLRFTAALSPDALPVLRDPAFPRHLLERVQPPVPPQLAPAATQRPLSGALAALPQPRDLTGWLLLLIVSLFALERWLATSRRRGASA